MTTEEIIARGIRATNVLENYDFKTIIADVEQDLFKQFRKTNVDELNKREETHRLAYTIDLLKAKLQKYVNESKIEIDRLTAQ